MKKTWLQIALLLFCCFALAAPTDAVAAKSENAPRDRTIAENPPPAPKKKLTPEQIGAAHQQAMAFFEKKEYEKSIAVYKELLESEPDDESALYNVACAYSLLKDKPKALEYLRKSVEAGYVNFEHMEQDTDLDNIRTEEGYKELLKKKAEYTLAATKTAVTRITASLSKSGVDAKQYKNVVDADRNFVYLHTKSDAEFAAIRKGLETYAEYQWKNLFQNKPQHPLYIVLLGKGDAVKVFRSFGIGGAFNPGASTLMCGDIPSLEMMKTSVITHEFTHALHFSDMFARRQMHPIWLIEGLATLFETSHPDGHVAPFHNHRLRVVQAAVQSGHTIPWKTMMKMNQKEFMGRSTNLAYAQARYMLFYMYEKGLLKKFYDEYTDKANYGNDKSALGAFEVVFGKPIDEVEHDWKQWIAGERLQPRPYLGVATEEKEGQLVVTRIEAGSPAAKAGIQNGDAITTIDGRPMKSTTDLVQLIRAKKVGDNLSLAIVRAQKQLSLKATLQQYNEAGPPPPDSKGAPYLGLAVEQKNGSVCAKEVDKGSPAEKAGIKPGTEILEFDGKKLATVREYLDAVKATTPGQAVKIKTKKGDEVWVVTATLTDQP